jgi:hypothetical protein
LKAGHGGLQTFDEMNFAFECDADEADFDERDWTALRAGWFGSLEPSSHHLPLPRPVLEMLVTLPGGGAASLAASAACQLLI